MKVRDSQLYFTYHPINQNRVPVIFQMMEVENTDTASSRNQDKKIRTKKKSVQQPTVKCKSLKNAPLY